MSLPLAVLLVATTTTAEQAKALYLAGSEAYRQGRYDVAIDAFEEVIALEPRPAALFSAAQAHRLQYFVHDELPHLERAVHLFHRYLDTVEDGGRREHAIQHLSMLTPLLQQRKLEADPKPRERPARIIVSSQIAGATARVDGGEAAPIPAAFEVKPGPHRVVVEAPDHLARSLETVAVAGGAVAHNVTLTPAPAQLSVVAPEGARVEVDGRVLGMAPIPGPASLGPGRHRLSVVARGRVPYAAMLDLSPGQAMIVQPTLPMTGQRISSWVLYGAGAALLIGGATTLGLALDREREAKALETRFAEVGLTRSEADRYGSLEGARDDLVGATIGLGVAAATSVVLASVLWIFDMADAPESP